MASFYQPPPLPETILRQFCEWLTAIYRLKITVTVEDADGMNTSVIDRRQEKQNG